MRKPPPDADYSGSESRHPKRLRPPVGLGSAGGTPADLQIETPIDVDLSLIGGGLVPKSMTPRQKTADRPKKAPSKATITADDKRRNFDDKPPGSPDRLVYGKFRRSRARSICGVYPVDRRAPSLRRCEDRADT